MIMIVFRIGLPIPDAMRNMVLLPAIFDYKNGEIIPLDGDIYELNEEVIESEEWTMPEEEIQNGLTIVVIGGLIRK